MRTARTSGRLVASPAHVLPADLDLPPDGWWRIEVADRGIGVPEEHRERIFAAFHRAPAAEGFPGNGLGLAICRRAIALHGGTVGVEANPGGGSIFFLTVAGADVVRPGPARAGVISVQDR